MAKQVMTAQQIADITQLNEMYHTRNRQVMAHIVDRKVKVTVSTKKLVAARDVLCEKYGWNNLVYVERAKTYVINFDWNMVTR